MYALNKIYINKKDRKWKNESYGWKEIKEPDQIPL
jgi:hypothetical protein